MNITNQELHACHLPQVIIEDTEDVSINWFALSTKELNELVLSSMYRVQDEIFKLFGGCEIRETQANTINPVQQNAFIPLKVWNVNLGWCFAEISIHQRVMDGCFADISIYG